ncbi:MAG: glycosyltransferase family 2 protein [Spirochaetes bacterium]|nr:glycosyltransferase family 2 protein [Spirochaetota bacterium]
MTEISIVVPLYNEEGNVEALHKEILDVCTKENYTFEIIFIDDGSTDKTPFICKSLHPIKYIKLRKNFGQTAAMDAGIKAAKYDYIITMDGDRQNNPADIPNLIKHLEENEFDVVSGWRKKRKDNFFKKFASRGANFLRGVLIKDGIHDSGCSLKIYKKECFQQISLYGEMHRFIPALLKIKGFKIGEVVTNHRPRSAGKTKYNWKRTIKGFIDMISVWFWNKYSVRPLHLLGGTGLFFNFLGFLAAVYTIYLFLRGYSLSDSAWPMLTVFLFLTGIQLFVSGLIADMLSKNYYEVTKDSSYSIKEIIENQ